MHDEQIYKLIHLFLVTSLKVLTKDFDDPDIHFFFWTNCFYAHGHRLIFFMSNKMVYCTFHTSTSLSSAAVAIPIMSVLWFSTTCSENKGVALSILINSSESYQWIKVRHEVIAQNLLILKKEREKLYRNTISTMGNGLQSNIHLKWYTSFIYLKYFCLPYICSIIVKRIKLFFRNKKKSKE